MTKDDYEKFSKYNVASERDAVDNQYENWMTKFDREPKKIPAWPGAKKKLVNYINDMKPSLVIDAGCDRNKFKGHIKNLVGFDARGVEGADYVGTYTDMLRDKVFEDGSADVIICHGSLHTGKREEVRKNVAICSRWLKPGGYMLVRAKCNFHWAQTDVNSYNWRIEDVQRWSNDFNLKVHTPVEVCYAKDKRGELMARFVWWWKKLSRDEWLDSKTKVQTKHINWKIV